MSPRTQLRWIYASAALCLAASGALWTWGFWPAPSPAEDPSTRRMSRPRSTHLTAAPPLDELRKLGRTRLRRPLVDPPAPPKKAQVVPKKAPRPVVRRQPRIEHRLVGTVLEKGKSTAIFIDRSGNIAIKEEGDELTGSPSGARVVRIELNAVTLSLGGQQLTLAMPKPEALK